MASLTALLLLAGAAHAQPDARGAHPVATWDAGDVSVAEVWVATVVYYAEDLAEAAPVVVVVHGAGRNGSRHEELASTLASRGFVAVVPDMPTGMLDADHDSHAAIVSGLLDWALAQSGDSGSPIEGRVDAVARGVVGHSWGGLAVFLAASRDPSIRAVVGFDPVDDSALAAAEVGALAGPSIHVMAEAEGCNDDWATAVFPSAAAPKRRFTVAASGHCDPEDPTDFLCPTVCGVDENRDATPVYRRYAVAWLGCLLQGDEAMAPWVTATGDSYDADVAAGLLTDVAEEGMDVVACAVPSGDADTDTDTDTDSDGDADADSDADPDARAVPARRDDGGCGCSAPGRPLGLTWLAIGLVAIAQRKATGDGQQATGNRK